MGQFVLLTAPENKASKKVRGLLGLGAESAFLAPWLGGMSTTAGASREGVGGPAGSRRVRGESGYRITACWQHQPAPLAQFPANCSPALLGLCCPKHIIKHMQLPCQSLAKLLLLHIMGQMNLQILVDSRTSFVLGSCWQLGQVVELWCHVLPCWEILLTKGAI